MEPLTDETPEDRIRRSIPFAARRGYELDPLRGFGEPQLGARGEDGPLTLSGWRTVAWSCGCRCSWWQADAQRKGATEGAALGPKYCGAHVEASPLVPIVIVDQFSGYHDAKHVSELLPIVGASPWPPYRFDVRHELEQGVSMATAVFRVERDGRLTLVAAKWDSSG